MVFKRVRDITLATIHEGLDSLENPVVMLNQYLRDMEEEIKKAEKSISKQIMLLESLKKDEQMAKEMVIKRMEQAEFALKAGEEELARKALLSKGEYEEKQKYYEELVQGNENSVSELKVQLLKMTEKYKEMRDKKYALVARANAAKAKQGIQKTLSNVHHEKATEGFRRMEDRIVEIETRTKLSEDAFDSLANERLTKLQYGHAIEEELNELKGRLAQKA